mgnify:FL=1|jgi:glyoxylate reductase
MRQFAKAEIACRAGQWKKPLPLARDPEHKTLGIVGMGGIGTVTARRLALGWGMRVIYHNRRRLAVEPDDFGVEYKDSLEGLLNEADIVSLHLPVGCRRYFQSDRSTARRRKTCLAISSLRR